MTTQKLILPLALMLVVFGCGKTNKKISESEKSSPTDLEVDHSDIKVNWYDELLTNYIRQTDNQLIKLSRKDTTEIEWLLDRVEDTDTAKYLIFQLGQDVADEGNTNPRFVTYGWVYIDSVTRKVYEYDLPNDNLIIWKK